MGHEFELALKPSDTCCKSFGAFDVGAFDGITVCFGGSCFKHLKVSLKDGEDVLYLCCLGIWANDAQLTNETCFDFS